MSALAVVRVSSSGGSMRTRKNGKHKGPKANLSDVPELMCGALSSIKRIHCEDFEQHCDEFHVGIQDTGGDEWAKCESERTVGDLRAMFPLLDADLVSSIHSDTSTRQQAIETLLALNIATCEPDAAASKLAKPPPRDLRVGDHVQFPALIDSDGLKVIAPRSFKPDTCEDFGSAWCDRMHARSDNVPTTSKPVSSVSRPSAAVQRSAKTDGKAAVADATHKVLPLAC